MNGLPTVTARRGVDSSELDLVVDDACEWFSGHFPGQPILPGVVQIGWAAHFAAEIYRLDSPPVTLERVKFKRPILPGARLTLCLERAADKVQYDYREHDTSVSSGVLCFGKAA